MNQPNTDLDERRYAGMTVNERLFVADILDQFDDAARRRDRQAMIAYLHSVELPESQAAETTDAILANPSFYGL